MTVFPPPPFPLPPPLFCGPPFSSRCLIELMSPTFPHIHYAPKYPFYIPPYIPPLPSPEQPAYSALPSIVFPFCAPPTLSLPPHDRFDNQESLSPSLPRAPFYLCAEGGGRKATVTLRTHLRREGGENQIDRFSAPPTTTTSLSPRQPKHYIPPRPEKRTIFVVTPPPLSLKAYTIP